MSFGVFLQFSFYPYNYYGELYLFDESVDVPMRNCCEIDVCCLCLLHILSLVLHIYTCFVLINSMTLIVKLELKLRVQQLLFELDNYLALGFGKV